MFPIGKASNGSVDFRHGDLQHAGTKEWQVKQLLFFCASVSIVAAAGCARNEIAPAPELEDAALRSLDAAYVEAWLKPDREKQERAVLALFDKRAVIMPGEGMAPAKGQKALGEFWFPDGEPPTEVSHFTHDIEAVDIAGDLGVVSGRYTLSFDYSERSFAQNGNYLFVARRISGEWKIMRMIWNDQPLTDV